MLTSTLVFLVIMLQGGAHPTYGIVAQIDPEVDSPYAECLKIKAAVDPKEIDPEKLTCLEVVQHDEYGNTVAKKYPPTNGRKMGNRT